MKRLYLITVLILAAFFTNGQLKFKTFPGTGFGIVVPDSNYIDREGGFVNKKLQARITLINQEADFSNIKFGEFMNMMLQEIITKGVTVLSDQVISPDSSRIIKLVIDYDITNEAPANKGRKDVTWFYFYNYDQKPILLMAAYPLESDIQIGESILKSIKTLKNIDKSVTRELFKNNFSITEDHAPLKYCGSSLGGIRLNMHGKFHFTGGDSSYCLIVPSTIALPKAKPDSMRTYMLNRLQIQVDDNVATQSWRISNEGKFILYEITGTTNTKLLYLAIKSDSDGYFEIWGVCFNQNKQLIGIFKKIAESLQRN